MRPMNFSQPTLAINVERYRAGVAEMMTGFKPTHFVTLVFNAAVTAKMAEADLCKFRLWMHRKITGKSNGPGIELPYIATLEHENSNLHIHALFRVPSEFGEPFSQHAAAVWAKLRMAGNVDVQAVHDVLGVSQYITKELKPTESHRLLLS